MDFPCREYGSLDCEVKDYCQAYGLVGGAAESGSYLWDAVGRRGKGLISSEAMRQLDELKRNLRQFPGVFLDDRHQYSIRAFMYADQACGLLLHLVKSVRSFSVGDGAPTPLPTLVMNHLMTTLRLDRLSFHHTTIDIPLWPGHRQGTGLWPCATGLGPEAETIAVGDSETDLSMFRVATRSFAPAQINCPVRLGCWVAKFHDTATSGACLMSHVPSFIRARARSAPSRGCHVRIWPRGPVSEVLRAADQIQVKSLIGALFDPATLRIFVR